MTVKTHTAGVCIHRILYVAVVMLLLPVLVLPAHAKQEEAYYIRQILGECLNEPASEAKIDTYLNGMSREYPQQSAVWEQIMDSWFWINQQMQLNRNSLPDGLPQDDTLAIVVMGYQLNPNGSMKPELLDRVAVAIRSAQKYPNAYIICTGGATSDNPDVTEASEMAQWLRICGIEESRIILEEASFSTTENAQNTMQLLYEQYPQIRNLAVVTSDYHIRRSYMMFQAAALYASGYDGQEPITLVGNAVCEVKDAQEESMRTQVWGLAILAGVDMPNT